MSQLPAEFDINRVEISEESAYVSSDSRNLQYRQRKTLGQRFGFRITSNVLEPVVLKKVMAYIGKIKRDNGVVSLTLPIYSESSAGSKTVQGATNAGGNFVELNNTTGIEVGDFFRFANHTKAYQVTDIGAGSINFAPQLMVSVSQGIGVTFNGMAFNCKIQSERPQLYRVTANNDSAAVELDLIEVW